MPGRDKHDGDAEERANHGQGPMEVPERRSPSRTFQQRLQSTGCIDSKVTHKEESETSKQFNVYIIMIVNGLCNKGGDAFDDGDEDSHFTDENGEEDSQKRFSSRIDFTERFKERNDVIYNISLLKRVPLGNCLKRWLVAVEALP